MSKDLLNALKQKDLLEYGSVITGELVREILNIEYPECGTREVFEGIALQELGAVDYVRNALLNEGKYLASNRGDYRILLPSENKRQIEAYTAQADRKIRRALKLSRHTPVSADKSVNDQQYARLVMKQEALRGRNQLVP